jgi:hypothetical protein
VSQALEHNSCSNAGDTKQGRIQDFKLGRGAHLKKLRRAEGGAKMFRVFRVKNHDFTPKNYIFVNCRGRRENFGVFRVKNHDFTPKNNFSTNQNRTYKCYNFNYSDNCTNHACAFSQSCLRCYGQHPLIQCKQQHFLPNRSGGAPRLRHPHIRPRFQSPVLNNSAQYPPRQNTQVTASGQPSYNYY